MIETSSALFPVVGFDVSDDVHLGSSTRMLVNHVEDLTQHRWEENIKMDLGKIGSEVVDFIGHSVGSIGSFV